MQFSSFRWQRLLPNETNSSFPYILSLPTRASCQVLRYIHNQISYGFFFFRIHIHKVSPLSESASRIHANVSLLSLPFPPTRRGHRSQRYPSQGWWDPKMTLSPKNPDVFGVRCVYARKAPFLSGSASRFHVNVVSVISEVVDLQ